MANFAESSRKSADPASQQAAMPRRALITATAALPAVALVMAAGDFPEPEAPAIGGDGRQPIYRETEHMRRFYQRCRF